MADTDFDWGDLFDDLGDWLSDLWDIDGEGQALGCVFAAIAKFPPGEERDGAIAACRERHGDPLGNAGRTLGGARGDIDDFLDELLGALEGGVDGIMDRLGEVLADAVGGLGDTARGTVGDIGDLAGVIIGQTGNSARNVLDIIGLSAGGAIDSVGGVLGDMASGIGNQIEDFLRAIQDAIRNAINSMTQAISNALNAAIRTVTNVVTGIVEQIRGIVEKAITGLTNLLERVIESVEDLINRAVDSITEVADRVFTAVADTVERISQAIQEAFTNIQDFIGSAIDTATQFIQQATETLQSIGNGIVESAQQLYEQLVAGIDRAIDELISTAGGAITTLRESLDSFGALLEQGLSQLGPMLQQNIAAPLAENAKALIANLLQPIDAGVVTPQEDLTRIFTCMGLPQEAAARARDIMNCVFPDEVLFGKFLQNLLVMWTAINIGLGWSQQLAQAAGIKALQDIQPAFPIAIPDSSATAEMQRMGLMGDAEATTNYVRSGFKPADAERLTALRRRVPEIGIIQVWFLRRFIDRDAALVMLGHLGFDPADQGRLLEMSFFIPPPADLITMAVRDVFSPDVAQRFGQFEDFPIAFKEFAAQQGISEEWALRYWGAHWALPSVQMGFEMLHRRVIGQEDLNLLLRAHDVMPFWREKLTQISYAPLTRVDVRRMHAMGVLTDQEVKDAYLDIGYSDENAERLLQFTKLHNEDALTAPPASLEDLTRTSIVGLYQRGTLTRAQAEQLLTTIGVGKDAADIFLDITDIDNDRKERDEQTQLLIDQAKLGIITFNEARDKLGALGLEPLEIERALTDLQRARDSSTKIPTHQELDQLFKARLIPDALYVDTMLRNGYSLLWAERFLALAKQGV